MEVDVDLGMWWKQCVLVCLCVMCVSCEVGQGESVSWRALLGSGRCWGLVFPDELSEVAQAKVIVHSLWDQKRAVGTGSKGLGIFSQEPRFSTPS